MNKVVCFKIKGEKWARMGVARPDATEDVMKKLLARVFNVSEDSVTILELN